MLVFTVAVVLSESEPLFLNENSGRCVYRMIGLRVAE
jgi:hypothetical protein